MATESPDGTVVYAGSGGSLVFPSGNVYTINSKGQVAMNGRADTSTGGVTAIARHGLTIVQQSVSAKGAPHAQWQPVTGSSAGPLSAVLPSVPVISSIT